MLARNLLAAVLCYSCKPASTPLCTSLAHGPRALIWQGFQHQWGYNHRINRLGDLVIGGGCDGQAPCTATASHSAASGTGPDNATFATDLVRVSGQNLVFATGDVSVVLSAARDSANQLATTVTAQIPDGSVSCVAVLQGYDLVSLGSAQKLEHFAIALGDVVASEGNVRADLSADLRAGCSSLECNTSADPWRYRLRIAYLFICADAVPGTPIELRDHYAWDEQTELGDRHLTLPSQSKLHGWQQFEMSLDRDLHMIEWQQKIQESDVSFFFKNWATNMQHAIAPYSWFSYRQRGSADIRSKLISFTLDGTNICRVQRSSQISWPGLDASADSTASLSSDVIAF